MEKWRWTRSCQRFFITTSAILVCLATVTQVNAASRQQLQELLAGYRQDDAVDRKATKESNDESVRWASLSSSKLSSFTSSPPEDPTTTASTASTKHNTVQSYQDFYRVYHGSKEGSQQAKQPSAAPMTDTKSRYGSPLELDAVRQANEHFLHIRRTARCQTPRAKVIRVQEYYPDPTKEYLPRCTILHRCGEDSGCCDGGDTVCAPKASQEVVLHFYTLSMGKQPSGKTFASSVEKLLFENHTECECRPINNLPRMMSTDAPSQRKGCSECPFPFSRREFEDGRCSCDCFDKQRRCLRIKRGRDALSETERRCVQSGHCHVPECEHGLFDTASGRCPRKYEDTETPRYEQYDYNHQSHRWSYFERD